VCCPQAGLYGALTRLHQADVFIADDECGEQIACLQVSVHRSPPTALLMATVCINMRRRPALTILLPNAACLA